MSYTLEELDTAKGSVRLERYSRRDYRVEVLSRPLGRWVDIVMAKTLPPARNEFRKEARRMARKV
jgi:hypothetical protein